MKSRSDLPKTKKQALRNEFKPKAIGYDFKFADEKNIQAVNTARDQFNELLEKVNLNKVTLDEIEGLFQAAKRTELLLKKAQAEIQVRKAFEEEKTDLVKDLVNEQPCDIAFTLALWGINFKINRAKLEKGDFSGVLQDIKGDTESAVLVQVATVSGIDPALVSLYDAVRSIKNIKSPEDFLELLAGLAISSGGALADLAAIIKVSGKSLFYTKVPKEVLESLEKQVEKYQDENDAKMSTVIDAAVRQLEHVSHVGLLPENKSEHEKTIALVNSVRDHIEILKKRVFDFNAKVAKANKKEKKHLQEKMDAVELQIKALEEKCQKLHFWKNLSRSILLNTIRTIESGKATALEEYAGVDIRGWLADNIRTASEKFDLKRALDADPEVVMASRTYAILIEHYGDNKAREKKREEESFESIETEARFLIALESQQKRGLDAVKRIASGLRFSLQTHHLHDATLSSNYFLLNIRKLAVAKALLKAFHLPVDQEEWNETLNFELFHNAIQQRLFGGSLNEGSTPSFSANYHEAARARTLSLISILNQLKSSGNTDKDGRHNKKINTAISEIIERYTEIFNDEEMMQDKVTGEWVCVHKVITACDDAKKDDLASLIQAKAQKLLSCEIADHSVQKKCIEEIEQYYASLSKRDSKLFSNMSEAQRKELNLLNEQLSLIHRMYRENPRATLIQSEKGDESDLGRETAGLNDYFKKIKAVEKAHEEKMASVRSNLMGALAHGGFEEATIQTLSNNFRRRLTIDQKTSENLVQTLALRHAAIEKYVVSKHPLSKDAILDFRAAYLADLTPSALEGLVKKLDESAQGLSEKENALEKVDALVDDFFEEKDKEHQKSLMSSKDKKMQLNDIARTREEIAITMYERLLLAENDQPADLVKEAGLVDEDICEAYRLTAQHIVAYREFIDRYGTTETKRKASERLQSTNKQLEKLSAPLENAWVSYQIALSDQKNRDPIYTASQHFLSAADFLIEESDRDALLSLSAAVDEAEKLHREYEKQKSMAVARSSVLWTQEVEAIFLAQLGMQKHPGQMVREYKEKFCDKVSVVLSPSKIISTEWGKRIAIQSDLVATQLSVLDTTYAKKIAECELKEKTLKKRLDAYNNASTVGKFVRSIKVSFKLGWPPIAVSRSDNGEKRENDLYVLQSQLAAEKQVYQEKRASLEAEKRRVEKNAKEIAQHLISTIRSEMKDGRIPAAKLRMVREFVEKQAPELLEKLDREVDWTVDFIHGILAGESVDDLKFSFRLIEKFAKEISLEAKIIFDLLSGRVPLLTDGESLHSHVEKCIERLLVNLPGTEKNASALNVRNAIRLLYIEPFILSQVTRNLNANIDQIKTLLTLVPRLQQEALLKECVSLSKGNESILFNVFHAVSAFSEAPNYAVNRDNLFRAYFEERITKALEICNDDSYTDEDYEKDRFVLSAADAAATPVAREILDEAISSALIMHQDETSPVQLKWSENLAWLVERYASNETANQYRLLRLKELCADIELQTSQEKSQVALNAFVDSMEKAHDENDFVLRIDSVFIDELMNSDTPSWMAEAILTRFAPELLQAMHLKWMGATFERMSSNDYEETDNNEIVLKEMIQERPLGNALDKLEDFVGEDGIPIVRTALQKISADVVSAYIAPALLEGHANDIATMTPEAESKIKLANSHLLQWLRSIPHLMRKSKEMFLFAPEDAAKTLVDDPAVKRLYAEHDLNVLSKAYYHVSKEDAGISAYQTLDLMHVNKILLLSPELRAKEKESWIENKRAVLRAEAALKAELAKKEESKIQQKSLISKRMIVDTDYLAEEMVEYPFEKFIQQMSLHWADSKENEYNYHKHPDIYYSHYLSQIHPIAERLVREKIVEEIFKLVEKNNSDSIASKKILRALSEIDKTMILPICQFDEKQVDPIIHLLNIDEKKKAYLRDNLLQLAKTYTNESATSLINWCAENGVVHSAVSGFLDACKKAAELRALMNCACSYFVLDAAFDDAFAGSENEADISLLLEEVHRLKDIPALQEYANNKIDKWIIDAEHYLLSNPLASPALVMKLFDFVEMVGISEQKDRIAVLLTTKRAMDDFSSEETSDLLLGNITVGMEPENTVGTLSPIEGVVVRKPAQNRLDLKIIKTAMPDLLKELASIDVSSYQFSRAIGLLRNMGFYAQLSGDEKFIKLYTLIVTDSITKLISAAQVSNSSTLELSSESGSVRSLKYLAELISNHTICSYIGVKTVATRVLALGQKASPDLVKVCLPLLLQRVKQLLSDVGFDEEKEWKKNQKMHVPSGMSMMAGAAAASAYLTRQESPNGKALRDILSLISAHGSETDKALITTLCVGTQTEKERLDYAKIMQGIIAKFSSEKKTIKLVEPVKAVVNSSASVGLFGTPDKDKIEWIKLRTKYANIAGDGWLSDTGKMFRENRPYLEVVQEMIDKVLKRNLKKNSGSASFETLKALKSEGYFECELKGKLMGLDELDSRFEVFRNIVSKPRIC